MKCATKRNEFLVRQIHTSKTPERRTNKISDVEMSADKQKNGNFGPGKIRCKDIFSCLKRTIKRCLNNKVIEFRNDK